MSLVELVFAMVLSGMVAIALGHVVTQLTHGVTNQEHRSQNQAEGALAMLRLRSELREANAINSLSSRHISFSHPDVTGDGVQDVITYDWDGTIGSQITRDVNNTGAEAILTECVSFNLAGLTTAPVSEELLAGHIAYGSATSTPHEFAASSTSYAAEVFTPSRTGAATLKVTRVRVYLRPLSTTGSVHVSIRTTLVGDPGTSLEVVSRPLTQLNPNGGWEDFRFGTNSGLVATSSFAVVVRCGSTGGSVGVKYDQMTGTIPATSSDYYRHTSDSGLTWTPITSQAASDLTYLVYGRYYDSSGTALAMSTTRINGVEMLIQAGNNSASPVRLDGAVHCVNTPEQVQ